MSLKSLLSLGLFFAKNINSPFIIDLGEGGLGKVLSGVFSESLMSIFGCLFFIGFFLLVFFYCFFSSIGDFQETRQVARGGGDHLHHVHHRGGDGGGGLHHRHCHHCHHHHCKSKVIIKILTYIHLFEQREKLSQ